MKNPSVSTDPADYRCTVEIVPRFRDLDAMGHVNNAVYFTYLEVGRVAYTEAIDYEGAESPDMRERFPFILAEIGCQYLAPARLDDTLVVGLRVGRLGGKSWSFEYLISRKGDGVAVATGRSTQVCFDYETGETAAVPEAFVEKVEAYERRRLRA